MKFQAQAIEGLVQNHLLRAVILDRIDEFIDKTYTRAVRGNMKKLRFEQLLLFSFNSNNFSDVDFLKHYLVQLPKFCIFCLFSNTNISCRHTAPTSIGRLEHQQKRE